jgi:hypothetical protein
MLEVSTAGCGIIFYNPESIEIQYFIIISPESLGNSKKLIFLDIW